MKQASFPPCDDPDALDLPWPETEVDSLEQVAYRIREKPHGGGEPRFDNQLPIPDPKRLRVPRPGQAGNVLPVVPQGTDDFDWAEAHAGKLSLQSGLEPLELAHRIAPGVTVHRRPATGTSSSRVVVMNV